METRCVGCKTEKAVVFIPEHCVQFQHLLASMCLSYVCIVYHSQLQLYFNNFDAKKITGLWNGIRLLCCSPHTFIDKFLSLFISSYFF